MGYLELDALYALRVMAMWAPNYRVEDILKAVNFYADKCEEFWKAHSQDWWEYHPHWILAGVSTFGLLQQHLPDRFVDDVQWTDIFSDPKLYQTAEVETLHL
jgi:hypothetical protein